MEETNKLEAFEKEARERLNRLNRNEDFIFFKEQVVEPIIAQLEVELSTADQMPEAVLRGKLKHVNSLKNFFKDVFVNINN